MAVLSLPALGELTYVRKSEGLLPDAEENGERGMKERADWDRRKTATHPD